MIKQKDEVLVLDCNSPLEGQRAIVLSVENNIAQVFGTDFKNHSVPVMYLEIIKTAPLPATMRFGMNTEVSGNFKQFLIAGCFDMEVKQKYTLNFCKTYICTNFPGYVLSNIELDEENDQLVLTTATDKDLELFI